MRRPGDRALDCNEDAVSEPTLWRRAKDGEQSDCTLTRFGHRNHNLVAVRSFPVVAVAAGALLIEQSDHAAFCQMVGDTLSNFFRDPVKVGEAATAVLNAAVRRYGTNGGDDG